MIKPLTKADREELERKYLLFARTYTISVALLLPGVVMGMFPPALLVWAIPGTFLSLFVDHMTGFSNIAFVATWALYYLATCGVFYLIVRLIARREGIKVW